jgi:hypothetical protein
MSSVNPCGIPGGTSLNTLSDFQMAYRTAAQQAIGAPGSWNFIDNPAKPGFGAAPWTLQQWQCAVQQGWNVGPWDAEQLADSQAGYNAVTACWPCTGQLTSPGTVTTTPQTAPLLPSVAETYLAIIEGHPQDPSLQSSFAPYTYAQILAAAAQYQATPVGSTIAPGSYPAGGGTVGTIPAARTQGSQIPPLVVNPPAQTPTVAAAGSGAVQTSAPAASTPTSASSLTSSITSDISSVWSDLTANPLYLVIGAAAVYFIFLRK